MERILFDNHGVGNVTEWGISVKNMLDSIFFAQQFVQEHHKLPGCDNRNRMHDFLLRDSSAKRMLRNGDYNELSNRN